MPNNSFYWPAHDATVDQMLAAGKSPREIAVAIGATRNAVIGRIWRRANPHRPKARLDRARPEDFPRFQLELMIEISRLRPIALAARDYWNAMQFGTLSVRQAQALKQALSVYFDEAPNA